MKLELVCVVVVNTPTRRTAFPARLVRLVLLLVSPFRVLLVPTPLLVPSLASSALPDPSAQLLHPLPSNVSQDSTLTVVLPIAFNATLPSLKSPSTPQRLVVLSATSVPLDPTAPTPTRIPSLVLVVSPPVVVTTRASRALISTLVLQRTLQALVQVTALFVWPATTAPPQIKIPSLVLLEPTPPVVLATAHSALVVLNAPLVLACPSLVRPVVTLQKASPLAVNVLRTLSALLLL